jgi:hypothetical protein
MFNVTPLAKFLAMLNQFHTKELSVETRLFSSTVTKLDGNNVARHV